MQLFFFTWDQNRPVSYSNGLDWIEHEMEANAGESYFPRISLHFMLDPV